MEKHVADDFFARLGETTLAPLLHSYALWLHEEARRDGIDKLMFLSREGYMMQRAYRAVVPVDDQLPNQYMYASRRLLNFAAIRRLDERALHLLAGDRAVMPVEHYLERIGLEVSDCEQAMQAAGFAHSKAMVVRPRDQGKLRKLWRLLAPQLLARAEGERNRFERYAHTVAEWENEKCGVVDIGWHGSMQASLSKLLDLPAGTTQGYYLGLHRSARQRSSEVMKAYLDQARAEDAALYRRSVGRSWEVLELFFTEREQSIIGLTERPDGRFEPLRESFALPDLYVANLASLQETALRFISAPQSLMGREQVIASLTRLMSRPTAEEAAALGDMLHHEPFGAYGTFAPIARPGYSLEFGLKHPMRLARDWHRSYWRVGFARRLRAGK